MAAKWQSHVSCDITILLCGKKILTAHLGTQFSNSLIELSKSLGKCCHFLFYGWENRDSKKKKKCKWLTNVTELTSQDQNAETESHLSKWLHSSKTLPSRAVPKQRLFSAQWCQHGSWPGVGMNLGTEAGRCPVSQQMAAFWLRPRPAALLCSCHDLFLLTQIALWPTSFSKNYFISFTVFAITCWA